MANPRGFFGDVNLGPDAGLLAAQFGRGQQSQQAPMQHKQNVLDRILGLYGADPATHIPDENRRAALGRGISAGAAAVNAIQGRGAEAPTLGQSLGAFFGGLQQAGPLMVRDARTQQINEALRSGALEPQKLQAMIQALLAQGDPDSLAQAKVLKDILDRRLWADTQGQSTGKPAPFQKTTAVNPKTGDNEVVVFDPNTGSFKFPDLRVKDAFQNTTFYNPETGTMERAVFDPETGRYVMTGIQSKDVTGQEKKLATDAQLVQTAVDDVTQALQTIGRGPSFLEWNAYKHDLTRGMVPDDVQGLLQAEEALVSHLARIVTGSVRAAASEPIRNAIFRSYLVAPGDSPLNREQTLRNLQMIADRLKTEAGRAWLRENAGVTTSMIADAETDVEMDGSAEAKNPSPAEQAARDAAIAELRGVTGG